MRTFTQFLTEANAVTAEVYHGTRRKSLTSFKVPPRDEGSTPISHWGVFFTDSRELAQRFAGRRGTVLRAQITLHNPHIEPPTRHGWTTSMHWEQDANDEERDAFIDALRAKGHDGIVFQTREGFTEYVVFDPANIRLMGPA